MRAATLSTAMIVVAPIMRAPGRCAKADRPLRKNSDAIADTDTARFRAAESSRHDVRTHQHLFVGQTVRHGRKVGHRVGHEQIFRLGAIDRIAKSPATHCLPPGALLSAALRMKAAKRGVRRARGRNCPCDYALTLAITGNGRAKFLDDPYRFVAHRQSPFDGIFALEDMYVGTADGRGGYADQRIEWSDVGHRFSSSTMRPGSTNIAAFIITMRILPFRSLRLTWALGSGLIDRARR